MINDLKLRRSNLKLKRGDFVSFDIKREESEDIMVFYIDKKEKKVYSVGQLINPGGLHKNYLEGFEVQELPNEKYCLIFYIESKGASPDQKYYYQLGFDKVDPKKPERKVYFNIAVI